MALTIPVRDFRQCLLNINQTLNKLKANTNSQIVKGFGLIYYSLGLELAFNSFLIN